MVLWMYERLDQLYAERFERPRHDEGHRLASAPSAARAWQQIAAFDVLSSITSESPSPLSARLHCRLMNTRPS
jgi:hypothetical protein